ncbi:MAG: CvpA family protein, partial [Treponema sp.]|nr:CvpA family protein [Treponema sp.]
MSSIVFIDLVFLVVVGIMAIRGYLRGLIKEVLSWAALVLGIIAAVFFYKNGAEFIRTKTMHSVKYIPEILSFIAIFIIVFLIFKMIEKVLKDVVNGIRLSGVDKFLGAVFGLVEGLALVSLMLFLIAVQPLFNSGNILDGSLFA